MPLEVFANYPLGTVTAGGTTTSDTAFTVSPLYAFPVANAGTTPSTFFRIFDQAHPSGEIMTVTTAPGGTASAQSWTVTRAAESSPSGTHSPNWICQQAVTAATLQEFKQASTAGTTSVTVASSTTETVVATYQPITADLIPGVTFEAVAFGQYNKNLGGALATLQWNMYWGGSGTVGGAYTQGSGGTICSLLTGTNAPGLLTTIVTSGQGYDVNGTLVYLSGTTATGNLNWWYNNGNALTVTASNAVTSNTASNHNSQATPIAITGNGPIFLTVKWSQNSATNTINAASPAIYRLA